MEGLEVDPVDRMDGETPLHKAVRFAMSGGGGSGGNWEEGEEVVELLLDAGADPRMRNKGGRRAVDLLGVKPGKGGEALRDVLVKAEYTIGLGDDIVVEDEEEPTGSGSESD